LFGGTEEKNANLDRYRYTSQLIFIPDNNLESESWWLIALFTKIDSQPADSYP
jgi:hypothetical protein